MPDVPRPADLETLAGWVDEASRETYVSVYADLTGPGHAEDGLGFNRLQERIDGISSKVLSETLQDMRSQALVDREVISDEPLRVAYSLTERGRHLEPVVEAMADWGHRHLDQARPVRT